MAQVEGDEDAFIGRRLKGRRRPIDLSLGYYLNANGNTPTTHSDSSVDQNRRFLPVASADQDVGPSQDAGMVLGTVVKENQMISRPKSPLYPLSQPSDPISVDLFLKSTFKVNATRNYKQARKRKIKGRVVNDLNDTEAGQDCSGHVALTVKPLKKSRTRARHRGTTRDLSVSGLRSRSNVIPSQLLHHRWQLVKNTRTISVDNRLDTSTGDGPSMKPSPLRESRVTFLQPGWNKAAPQSGASIKLPRKPTRVNALYDAARSALSFESIEEHDKKLDLWLASGSHGTKRGKKQNVTFVHGIPPLPFSASVVSKSHQLNNKPSESVSNVLKASNLSQNAGPVPPYPQQSGISDNAGLKRSARQTDQNTLVPGQKLTHLGDMLGELRLNAKAFCHASGNVPSPG